MAILVFKKMKYLHFMEAFPVKLGYIFSEYCSINRLSSNVGLVIAPSVHVQVRDIAMSTNWYCSMPFLVLTLVGSSNLATRFLP